MHRQVNQRGTNNVREAMRMVNGDISVADDEVQGEAMVWNHIMAVIDSLALKAAVKLGLFDAIHRHGSPMSLHDLTAALPSPCTRPATLRRLMSYLTYMRLVEIVGQDDNDPSFSLTPAAAAFLVQTSNKCLTSFITIFLDEGFLGALHMLDVCIAGGGMDKEEASAFELVSGETVFERAARDPVMSHRFNEGMAGSARVTAAALVEGARHVFDGVTTVVDVGGGVGTVAKAIRSAFPGIRCTVFDLSHVVESLPASDGVEYVAGDMFESVPHADAVLLMRVLHDWGDEKSVDILRRCREAINPDKGKLIIVDIVVDDDNEDHELHHARAASDVMMMAYGGKERTEKEWRSLLLRAGFSRCSIAYIKALQHVIEAHP